ncbi:hypothetical protein [Streptomyces violascens]|uniref:Uncharacterized protein n=1 Tax=Streptomyces violascens TaxID=67381 RepID=A0ABQ3QVA4_9ACTN|nr:hypothetical protein [Streptomyces violascens]GGU26478.1 hypothetical protein GCM10010289_54740 [Streptomyces violascens]GHI41211.1 hypothetical protein Sviol_56190 [Streptomyces violascens]
MLRPREVGRLGLRDRFRDEDYRTSGDRRRARRTYRSRGKQRARAEIARLIADMPNEEN